MKETKKQPKEQEFFVDDKETVITKDNEINDRINKLFGETSDVSKKELSDYDPVELQQTRRKLLFLFVGVVVAGVIIIALLLNPLELNFGKNNNEQEQEENNNSNINKEPEYPLELNLFDEKVTTLNQQIMVSVTDQKEIDLFPIYVNDRIDINDIPNNIKLFYLKKNYSFYDMLKDNKVNDYVATCNKEGIIIDKTEFDKVYNYVYGNDTLIGYSNVNYEFPVQEYQTKKITLTFDTDKYIVKCNDYSVNNNITKFVQQDLVKAVETESTIELYQKVVFVTYSGNVGVYKDPAFKTLITNDKSAVLEDYITQGNTYKYTFNKEEGNYYLSKIELTKEDN